MVVTNRNDLWNFVPFFENREMAREIISQFEKNVTSSFDCYFALDRRVCNKYSSEKHGYNFQIVIIAAEKRTICENDSCATVHYVSLDRYCCDFEHIKNILHYEESCNFKGIEPRW
jgi:hypothetical protein